MNIDNIICKTFKIEGQTNTPFVGSFDRNHLGVLFNELGHKVGAEIGVANGVNSEALLKVNPELKLFCVDPWTPYKHWSERRMKKRYTTTIACLAPYNVVILRKTSMEALLDIPDASLDFVYIDARHDYVNFRNDLNGWDKKVHSGGIVSGHDYTSLHRCGVLQAVNEYVKENDIYLWYLTSEPALPSWFWVKL